MDALNAAVSDRTVDVYRLLEVSLRFSQLPTSEEEGSQVAQDLPFESAIAERPAAFQSSVVGTPSLLSTAFSFGDDRKLPEAAGLEWRLIASLGGHERPLEVFLRGVQPSHEAGEEAQSRTER